MNGYWILLATLALAIFLMKPARVFSAFADGYRTACTVLLGRKRPAKSRD